MPTNNSINTPKPIDVSSGGTGLSTATTAYGVLAAGTTATGAFQNIGTGSAGEVLTSNGAGVLPSFQAAGGGGGDVVLLSSQNLAGVNTVTFNSFVDNTVYAGYQVKIYATTGGNLVVYMRISLDNGATFLNTGYEICSGQFTPALGFFNWVSGTNQPEWTFNALFSGYPMFTTIDLMPFGENERTVATSFGSYTNPALIWASFQHPSVNANAFQIYNQYGTNWTTGRACLYGYKK